MKINKTVCDMCGCTIDNSHPMRLVIQSYQQKAGYKAYEKVKQYDICDKCESKLPSVLSERVKGI